MVGPTSEVLYLLGLLYVSRHLNVEFPLVGYTRFVALIPSVLLPLCVYLNQRKGEVTGLASSMPPLLGSVTIAASTAIRFFKKLAKRRGQDLGGVVLLTQGLSGKLFGERGYISQKLFETLFKQGLQLITSIHKNMKNRLLPGVNKLLLESGSSPANILI